jgi:hypothetical protein
MLGQTKKPLFVRGTTVDPARRFAERRKGSEGWDAFIDALSPVQRRLVDDPIQRRRWYDLELYADVVDAAARHLAPADPDRFLTDLGGFVMDDGVTTLYKAFFLIASPSFVIKGSALLWGMFFKGSKLKVIARARKWVKVAILDAAFCHRSLCISISGGMISALRHAGARNVRMDHHVCISEGRSSRCEFHFCWD